MVPHTDPRPARNTLPVALRSPVVGPWYMCLTTKSRVRAMSVSHALLAENQLSTHRIQDVLMQSQEIVWKKARGVTIQNEICWVSL